MYNKETAHFQPAINFNRRIVLTRSNQKTAYRLKVTARSIIKVKRLKKNNQKNNKYLNK